MNFSNSKNNLPTTKDATRKSPQINLFPIKGKKVILSYTGEEISSDGGLLLLKETEKRIGLIDSLCNCITDNRNQSYIMHTLHSLMTQRVYQIAAGYEDANDCDSLRSDSIFKICADKLPGNNEDLSSQPTMSRFENSITRTNLYKIAECFGQAFVKSYDKEPPVIIIDCDDTNHNTYGGQQLTIFNNYYGEYCYMPLHIYEGLSGKLITTILKPGRRSKSVDVFSILKRVIEFLRQHWKNTRIILRGDSHFCSSDFMDWAKKQYKVNFITGLTGNQVLNRLSEKTVKSAEASYQASGCPQKIYHSFSYKAASWQNYQRAIVKVEVNDKGTNIRYIVTDLQEFRATKLYELGYCARGKMELLIKEHKTYLKSERSSCHRFEANQFRLFLHSAAYVLMHSLQKEVLRGTKYYNSTMKTLQLKLIKVAAKVKELKTKIIIECPRCYPDRYVHVKCFEIFELLRFR